MHSITDEEERSKEWPNSPTWFKGYPRNCNSTSLDYYEESEHHVTTAVRSSVVRESTVDRNIRILNNKLPLFSSDTTAKQISSPMQNCTDNWWTTHLSSNVIAAKGETPRLLTVFSLQPLLCLIPLAGQARYSNWSSRDVRTRQSHPSVRILTVRWKAVMKSHCPRPKFAMEFCMQFIHYYPW